MLDLYGAVLAKALFPAFEAVRGRPTVAVLKQLRETEQWTPDRLRELQRTQLHRLVRHAYHHTEHYRDVLDERGLRPEHFTELAALATLPLLDRATVRATLETRTATTPAVAVRKTTSGTSGQPVTVKYCAESRHWRDATRWRGYGWGGYEIGMRVLHYWGVGPPNPSWAGRKKAELDHWLKRDRYVDCTPRGEAALAEAVATIVEFRPQVLVAYAAGAGALARYITERGLRTWSNITVLTGAERLWPHDRLAIEAAFGPVFETYGCREVMLIGSECASHDGLHTSMETMIVELLVREPDGSLRAAAPGETGEVAITDLHNLACPMIRYLTGDLAVARGDDRCACGRGLVRIGPIEGRVTHTLRDGAGRPVSGLVFNILFATVGELARTFQVVQRLDGSVVLRIVLMTGDALPAGAEHTIRAFAARYLPDTAFAIELVGDIPPTRAGKREVVIVEAA